VHHLVVVVARPGEHSRPAAERVAGLRGGATHDLDAGTLGRSVAGAGDLRVVELDVVLSSPSTNSPATELPTSCGSSMKSVSPADRRPGSGCRGDYAVRRRSDVQVAQDRL